MENVELLPNLFRTEYRKIISTLIRKFGFEQIEIAEDIAGDTFLTASEMWGIKGVPPNPTAWLYKVAKNKALNYLQRKSFFFAKLEPGITKNFEKSFLQEELDLSPQNINDSQLQMMFAVCNPTISPEAQIGLSLRILCGFGIDEIADAFLTNKETINKRLFRAKEKLRQEKIEIKFPDASEIDNRLNYVVATIYLLFNEGYYSASQNRTLRKELCIEAMRLCLMLIENEPTNKPQVNALLSLMCFHASRFEARLNDNGENILYNDQDESLWDSDLISKGEYFFNRAATGKNLTKYHLEAAIARWHTQKEDTPEKWESILQFYNLLLQLEYSPSAALNRTYALAKVYGKSKAIQEAEKLNLSDNHFYFALLGELYSDIDDLKAVHNFERALKLTKSESEKCTIEKKIQFLRQNL